jgi:hypothetical protein
MIEASDSEAWHVWVSGRPANPLSGSHYTRTQEALAQVPTWGSATRQRLAPTGPPMDPIGNRSINVTLHQIYS